MKKKLGAAASPVKRVLQLRYKGTRCWHEAVYGPKPLLLRYV